MSAKIHYFPANEQERQAALRDFRKPKDDLNLLRVDLALGFAEQCICTTRDELAAYARDRELVPYLRSFLERRGWLDKDWARRVERLEAEYRQHRGQ